MSTKQSFMRDFFNGSVNESIIRSFPIFNTDRADFQIFSQSVSSWLKSAVNGHEIDKNKKLPQEVLQGLREMGLFGMIIPEDYGGSGFTQTLYTRSLELIGHHDMSTSLTVGAHSSIGLKALLLFGTEQQKKIYFPKLATGEMIAAFALTEPVAGSDANAIQAQAEKKDDHYVLNGTKLWITNGGFANFFTVFARDSSQNNELTAFIVTRDCGGVSTGQEEEKLGLKASSTVEVNFKDVVVPLHNVIGKPGEGFKIAMSVLNQGRLGLAGGAVGVMRDLLNQSMEYSQTRKAFGNRLCDFGIIQNMILRMTQLVYSAESMTYFTTHLVDGNKFDYSLEAAICKVFATDAAWEVVNLALQIHGGNGYMVDYGIERRLRDLRIGSIFEGTNEILRLFIALMGIRDTAAEYKSASQEIGSFETALNFESIDKTLKKLGFLSDFAVREARKVVAPSRPLTCFAKPLEKESARLADSSRILAAASSKAIRTFGKQLANEQLCLSRLADIAIHSYQIATCLSRANAVMERNKSLDINASEMRLVQSIIREAKIRINQLDHDLGRNHDQSYNELAKKLVLDKTKFGIDSTL